LLPRDGYGYCCSAVAVAVAAGICMVFVRPLNGFERMAIDDHCPTNLMISKSRPLTAVDFIIT
jgi:hypothetical protein